MTRKKTVSYPSPYGPWFPQFVRYFPFCLHSCLSYTWQTKETILPSPKLSFICLSGSSPSSWHPSLRVPSASLSGSTTLLCSFAFDAPWVHPIFHTFKVTLVTMNSSSSASQHGQIGHGCSPSREGPSESILCDIIQSRGPSFWLENAAWLDGRVINNM